MWVVRLGNLFAEGDWMDPLRVVFVTQEDPFYVAEFFRAFIAVSPSIEPAQVVGTFILDTLGMRKSVGLLKLMHQLYGNLGVIRLAFRYALRCAQIVGYRVASVGKPVSVKQILDAAGFLPRRLSNVNSTEGVDAIRALQPDVILSISASQKFSPAILAIPRLGCFNSHSGDLPRFRGVMPTFWTLYENEPDATVTVHKMAERIDAGEIWSQRRIPIAPTDSLHDVIIATKQLSAKMMVMLIAALAEGEVKLHANDSSEKRYYKFPKTKDSAELRRRGRKLL
jgi:methionyl-tRNA formyltransferase